MEIEGHRTIDYYKQSSFCLLFYFNRFRNVRGIDVMLLFNSSRFGFVLVKPQNLFHLFQILVDFSDFDLLC